MLTPSGFDPQALLDAVDAQRRERGMTWAALSGELHISTTTIKNMTERKWGLELDGVIGLASWVGRTVESFAGGDGGPPPKRREPNGGFIRFDTKALHAALNEERERRGMTWQEVAAEIWPTGPWGADKLKGLAKGGRGEVYSALAICTWLGRTIQSFVKESVF